MTQYGGLYAYPPATLLKIALLSYSKGIFSSRLMEEACKENILFIAVTGDAKPDHSTIANFIKSIGDDVIEIFAEILFLCNQLDLIDGEVFAVDGCKISSNAAKEWSGKKLELRSKKKKLIQRTKRLLEKHKQTDKNNKTNFTDNDSGKLMCSKGVILHS